MTDNNLSTKIEKMDAIKFEEKLTPILGKNFDINIERFNTAKEEAVVVFIKGLCNRDLIDRDVIKPLKSSPFNGDIGFSIKSVYKTVDNIADMLTEIYEGSTALFYSGTEEIVIIEFKDNSGIPIMPESETVVRGPKEGFSERLLTNASLLRRKIRTNNLIIEKMVIGKQTNTPVAIAYLENIVNKEVLEEVRKRLNKIDVDSILDVGQIEQYIEAKPNSLISTIGLTQKPDIAAARLLEGRVAIMCDGTPHVLTIPELFIENLHSSEDYYSRTLQTNFSRIMRLIGLMVAVLLPGLSVAFITFNPEMVPIVFLNTLIVSTEITPFPIAAEILFLLIMFELLQEAGARLPKTFGSAITIVGALIIGEAVSEAGIVSQPAVIVAALTSVSSLLVPRLKEFVTITKFIILLLGATMGLIGIGAGLVLLIVHIISADSFGIPMVSSFSRQEIKDGFVRKPLPEIKVRPKSIVKENSERNETEMVAKND
ncbi:MAG: spore germination protein [Clostridia bacterium]